MNFRGIKSDLNECFRKTLINEEDTEEEQDLTSETDDVNKERVLKKTKKSQRNVFKCAKDLKIRRLRFFFEM